MCPNGNKKTREKTITNSTLFAFANLLQVRATTLFLLGLAILPTIPGQAVVNAQEFKISLPCIKMAMVHELTMFVLPCCWADVRKNSIKSDLL